MLYVSGGKKKRDAVQSNIVFAFAPSLKRFRALKTEFILMDIIFEFILMDIIFEFILMDIILEKLL